VGRYVVISGTDTGVGKTCVGAGLARALVDRGVRVVALKPVESGCGPAVSPEEDGAVLAAAARQAEPRAALLRLGAPVAPPLAADLEGVAIPLAALVARVRGYAEGADVAIVEGAGGLCSPLAWDGDLTHVAQALDGAPVLVVGADRLGVVNHVLLTVHALVSTWLTPLGVVLSAPERPDASTGTNAATLRRLLVRYTHPPLAERVVELPRVAGPDEAAAHLGAVAAWVLA
jgi:dethiobiotin synthetase